MTDGTRGRLRANDAGTQDGAWFAIANPSGPLSVPSIHLRILWPWVRAEAAPCTAPTFPSSGRKASLYSNARSLFLRAFSFHSHDGPGTMAFPASDAGTLYPGPSCGQPVILLELVLGIWLVARFSAHRTQRREQLAERALL
jgi:hypothetical protein